MTIQAVVNQGKFWATMQEHRRGEMRPEETKPYPKTHHGTRVGSPPCIETNPPTQAVNGTQPTAFLASERYAGTGRRCRG